MIKYKCDLCDFIFALCDLWLLPSLLSSIMNRAENLQKWLRGNSIEFDRDAIEIRNQDSSIAIYSRRPIDVDECIARILKSAVLSAHNCTIAKLLRVNRVGGALALVMAVMYEVYLGVQSKWYEYLQSLPDEESALPLMWPEEKAKEFLRGTELQKALINDRQLLHDDYESVLVPLMRRYPKRFPIESISTHFSFQDFQRCSSVVVARYFQVDSAYSDALVPLADAFNHKTDGEHIHLESSDDSDTIELRVVVRVPEAGMEVYNTYGQHSNAYLMMKYGFCEQENPYNVVSIEASELLFTEGLGRRLEWWELNCELITNDKDCRLEVDSSSDDDEEVIELTQSFNIDANGTPDPELDGALRVLSLSDKQFKALTCKESSLEVLKIIQETLLSTEVKQLLASIIDNRKKSYYKQPVDCQSTRLLIESEQEILKLFNEWIHKQ